MGKITTQTPLASLAIEGERQAAFQAAYQKAKVLAQSAKR